MPISKRRATNHIGYSAFSAESRSFIELIIASRLRAGDWYSREREVALGLVAKDSRAAEKLFSSVSARELDVAKEQIGNFEAQGFSFVSLVCENYPPQLKCIDDPPLIILSLGGPIELLSTWPLLSVVGARKATLSALDFSSRISADIVEAGVGVVSGFARGVDAAAHRGSLSAACESFPGVGVLGSGHHQFYPSQNKRLYREFLQRGGIVLSEHLPQEEPRPWSFPRRNRIIAGLSSGCIVVEAGERSGSLITARLSLEYGREVFAVPGAAASCGNRGSNLLIGQGAHLLLGLEDLKRQLPELAWREGGSTSGETSLAEGLGLHEIDKRLYLLFGDGGIISQDQIAHQFNRLSRDELRSSLFRLEAQGLLESLGAGRWRAGDLSISIR